MNIRRADQGITTGSLVGPRRLDLATETGEVAAKVQIMDAMKEGPIRVPHGWWFPEMRGDPMGGGFISSDAVLCPDSDEYLDHEQGIPYFKGFPGRVTKRTSPPAGLSTQTLEG